MKANVIINATSEEEAWKYANQLKKDGYTRTANGYWTEIWEKNGQPVQLNREF